MLRDLAALTPPAIVCAAVIAGIVALLRWEMSPKSSTRQDMAREDLVAEHDNSVNNGIIDHKISGTAAVRDVGEAGESRDSGGPRR
jgi:hypothetical protein